MAVGELAMAMTDLGMVHQLPRVVSLKKMAPTVSSPGPSAYQAHVITTIPDADQCNLFPPPNAKWGGGTGLNKL